MDDLLQRLIVHVADFVGEVGGDLPKTKLVKLLYLIDTNFYRHFRRILTGARWFYYLYGPYAHEIDSAIKSIEGFDLAESQFLTRRGRKGFAYKATIEEDLRDILPLDSRQVVYNTLRKWAIEDLNTILDYVYFDTPPMKEARFGEFLDFSRIPPVTAHGERERRKEVSIPRERMEELRRRYWESADRRRQRAAQIRVVPPVFDRMYARAVELLGKQERSDLEGLWGKSIEITDGARQALSEQS